MTTTKPTVYEALSAVMERVQAVGKKERNNAQGFNFRGIDAVVNAVGPALREHNVIVTPTVLDYQYSSVEIGAKRTPMGHARVMVGYEFHGPAGDSINAVVAAEAMDSGDKATAKAMSVAFRTALLQALCLPTDEPDPDHAVYERSHPQEVDHRVETWLRLFNDAETIEDVEKVAQHIAAADALADHDRTVLLKAYSGAKSRLTH